MKSTQRIRRLVLPVLLLFLLAVPVRAECSHEFTEMRQEPTCAEDGLRWLECVYCGYSKDFEFIEALPHTFSDWYVVEGPTCTRDGVQARDCMVCGFREEAALSPPGHEYVPEIKAPTCTAGGYTRYTCSACSSYYIVDYTKPLGHSYDSGVLIKEPTDTALGRVRFTCIRCSETYLTTYAFRDISPDAYYFTPVIWAGSRGITSGLDETHFGPAEICNRAQVVTFLWRAAGKPEPASSRNPFLDVPRGCFYEKAVLWAFENGITTGTDITHFAPAQSCSRAQVVTFLHRFRGCPEPEGSTVFSDVPEGTFYHKPVLWAAQRGITLGMDAGRFCPELTCSRAQIVTFLYRDEKNP